MDTVPTTMQFPTSFHATTHSFSTAPLTFHLLMCRQKELSLILNEKWEAQVICLDCLLESNNQV
jgi:hypothetical protein